MTPRDFQLDPAPGAEYIYVWGNDPTRAKMKGRRCRIIRNLGFERLIEFTDNNERVVASKMALRRAE